MIKKTLVMGLLIAVLILPVYASAQQQQKTTRMQTTGKGYLGIGLVFGEPTGVTAKWWLTKTTAIDATAAWSLSDDEAFQIHADYLVHKFGLIQVQHGQLPVYLGIGGRIKFADDTKVSLRIPLGVSYLFSQEPFEIFGEIVPSMDLIPSTKGVLMGGVGIRYYF